MFISFFLARLDIELIKLLINSFKSIFLKFNLSSPYSILVRSKSDETISDSLSELCNIAFAKTLACFLSSNAPSINVSEFALITLTGVLNSCERFEIKSLLIESRLLS